jgi:hypothetical protein
VRGLHSEGDAVARLLAGLQVQHTWLLLAWRFLGENVMAGLLRIGQKANAACGAATTTAAAASVAAVMALSTANLVATAAAVPVAVAAEDAVATVSVLLRQGWPRAESDTFSPPTPLYFIAVSTRLLTACYTAHA